MPVSEMLEARGFNVHLGKARHRKQVPARQSDGQDWQGMQSWPPDGRLSGSWRPEAERCAVRASRRHRAA